MRLLLIVTLGLSLSGCQLIRSAVGLEEYQDKDGNTKVRSVADSVADQVGGLIGLLGPWGILAGAGISVAKRIIRHREILAHGQKDDDLDGIPDDEQRPAVTVTATSSNPPAPPAA